MATESYMRGDTLTIHFAPVEDDDTPTDLTDATAEVEISTAACIKLPLTRAGDGFDWPLSDATIPHELRARAYPAQFVITWASGGVGAFYDGSRAWPVAVICTVAFGAWIKEPDMTTITWRRGSADPLVFQPVQADGTPAPLDGLAMQLRVQAGGACIPLDGVAAGAGADAGFEVFLMPLIDLPPRVYRASEYYDAGTGWRWVADHVLNIEGGC